MSTKKSGAMIKKARTTAGMTQDGLAKKAACGLTAEDISAIERGEGKMTQTQAKRLAAVLDMTQSSLLEALKADTAKPAAKTTGAKTSSGGAKTAKTAAAASKTAKASSTAAKAAKASSAAAGKAAKTSSSAGKTSKTSSAAAKSAKTSASGAKAASGKTGKSAGTSAAQLTMNAEERKLVIAYRAADRATKDKVLSLLAGEGGVGSFLGDLLGNLAGELIKK